MKTITMYELLGMVKDNKAPKKIIAGSEECEYFYDSELKDYRNIKTNDKLFEDELEEYIKYYLNDEVEILKEEKKIPEKLPYYSLEKIQKAKNKDEWLEERIILFEKRINDLHIKMNDLLDYLESKGDE